MAEIEFLDAADETEVQERPRTFQRAWLLAALLWTCAAAASVVAPFGTFYAVDLPGSRQAFTVDGWGRESVPGGDEGISGPRYGIVFVVVAAALLVSVALAVAPRWRTTRLADVVALVAAGALAGVLGVLYLEVRTVSHNANRTTVGDGPGLTVSAGALFWWGAGAIVLVAAGHVTRLGLRPRRPPQPPAEPTEVHADDESLTS